MRELKIASAEFLLRCIKPAFEVSSSNDAMPRVALRREYREKVERHLQNDARHGSA